MGTNSSEPDTVAGPGQEASLPWAQLPSGRHVRFDNAFVRALPADASVGTQPREVLGAAYSWVWPTPVAAPLLLAHSAEVAAMLGLTPDDVASPAFAQVFGGNALLAGMQPHATNYGGHQFGHWAGQLGDGRAISLGEWVDDAGGRHELQLKGAGPTPYSRHADGRAVLRSSVREFLCSEAMHHLGVPTTRALCLVGTGEQVVRDMFYDGRPRAEPGAIVCRVAPSFLRFGHFQLPAARGDIALLRQLVDFALRRDFPWIPGHDPEAYAEWFAQICERTAILVAHWMRVGFVHGVMNTDNLSILGLTIDYGPYGWIDDYDPDWTPNTTDAHGRRYRFGWQPRIAYWNLTRLAAALAPLFSGTAALEAGLARFQRTYAACEREDVARKLGLAACRDEDLGLMQDLQELLQRAEADMTLFFRALPDWDGEGADLAQIHAAFYDAARRDAAAPALLAWQRRYAQRLGDDPLEATQRRAKMDAANPRYVLRNYLAQEAIDLAEQGDSSGVTRLLEVLRRPYEDQPEHAHYARRRPDWARDRPGCSTLSCSS